LLGCFVFQAVNSRRLDQSALHTASPTMIGRSD
jgi:hypothetical protein